MHMPQGSPDASILRWCARGEAGLAEAAGVLRARLDPQRWPLPVASLPAGSALVGGAVRDGLLDRLAPQPDLDLVVPADAIALCRELGRRHGGSTVVLDGQRSIARLVLQGWSIDLARLAGDTLMADLTRRDFRLNALALPLDPAASLLDPTGGLADLAAARVVAVQEENLLADPLRLLRGVRLAAELGFGLEPRTWEWIRRHGPRLGEVAPERVLVEVQKLAACPAGGHGLALALDAALLAPWMERAPAAEALERLTPEAAEARGFTPAETEEALPLARLGALFDRAAMAQLHASRNLQRRCGILHRWRNRLIQGGHGLQQRLEALGERERLNLHQELEADLPSLLLEFPESVARSWLRRWRRLDDPLFHPRPPIDGLALQEKLGMPPSPAIGRLLQALTLESAFERIQSPDQALAWARIWLQGTTA
jgi:tRNA nucleotidyltransferase (CCA-adding enzyme)